jgi:hypothetical protein
MLPSVARWGSLPRDSAEPFFRPQTEYASQSIHAQQLAGTNVSVELTPNGVDVREFGLFHERPSMTCRAIRY